MRSEGLISPKDGAQLQMAALLMNNGDLSSLEAVSSENVRVAEMNRSMEAALWRILETAGQRVTITFDREHTIPNPSSGIGEAQTPVSASVVLPFGWDELVAKVESIQRNLSDKVESEIVQFGDVTVDLAAMEVRRGNGQKANLTAQEFKTLKLFLRNPGKVLTREELLNQAWGYDNYPCTRTVDNHVLRLRQKLESNPAKPVHFRTVVKIGYKFVFDGRQS